MSANRQMEDPVGRDEYVISRLRQILRRHHERASWNQISKDIQAANGGEGYATVDRRTLPLICSGDKYDQVWLSLAQLVALDKYFVLTNEDPLFVRTRSLIDSIAETSEVAFYVAAKYHRELGTDAVSAFDLRAITTLLRSRLSRMTNSIIDVVSPKDWRASKRRSETIANVAVGSPVVNHASDRLLSSMLGFDVNNKTHTERLPFFIVRRPNERRLTSGFIRTKLHAIRRNAIEAESISKDHRALVFLYLRDVRKPHHDTAVARSMFIDEKPAAVAVMPDFPMVRETMQPQSFRNPFGGLIVTRAKVMFSGDTE